MMGSGFFAGAKRESKVCPNWCTRTCGVMGVGQRGEQGRKVAEHTKTFSLEEKELRWYLSGVCKLCMVRRWIGKSYLLCLAAKEKTLNDWAEALSRRMCFFTKHVIKLWTSLPQDVVDAKSINGFKNQLEKFVDERFIRGC